MFFPIFLFRFNLKLTETRFNLCTYPGSIYYVENIGYFEGYNYQYAVSTLTDNREARKAGGYIMT